MKKVSSTTISMTSEMYNELENTFGKGKVSRNVVKMIRDGLDNRKSLPKPQELIDLIRKKDPEFLDWLARVNSIVEERERG